MARLSEETIEKAVVSKKKPTLKVNRKTSKKQESISDTPVVSKNQEKELETASNGKTSTPEIKKRNIKDISKKTTAKREIKNSVKQEKNKNTQNIKSPTTQKQKSNKRTLHLNIEKTSEKEDSVSSSISHAIDTSINQNSPFFYEPSVFEKFNISVTSIDTESEENEIIEPVENTESTNNSDIDTENEIITNTIDDSQAVSSENTVISESIQTINIIESPSTDSSIDVTSLDDSDNIEIFDNTNLEDILTIDDLAENDSSILDNIENELLEIEKLEVADTIDDNNNASKQLSSTPIGKFFNSSIPSMNSTETANTKFEKLKKSIFSNISPIFKKFTFEEANMVINGEETEELDNSPIDLEPIIPTIPENVFESNITDTSFSPEFEISAKHSSIELPTSKNTSISTSISNDLEPSINYSSILTTDTNNNITIDDEIIDELINTADFIDDEIIVEEDIEENIEQINLDETEEENYSDDTFSIEAYFGLDKLKDEDFEEINFNTNKIDKNVKDVETVENEIELEESNLSPTEFVDKFLEDNTEKIHTEIVNTIEQTDKNSSSDNKEPSISVETENIKETQNEIPNTNLQTENINPSEFSKLLESFNKTISTLSDRIANLEAEKLKIINDFENSTNVLNKNSEIENDELNDIENNIDSININEKESEKEFSTIFDKSDAESDIDNLDITDINEIDLNVNDIDINEINIEDLDLSDINIDDSDIMISEDSSPIENTGIDTPNNIDIDEEILVDNLELDTEIENELLSEFLEETNLMDSTEAESTENNNLTENNIDDNLDILEDSLLEDFLLENIYEDDLKKLEVKNENVQTINHFAEMSDEYKDEPLSDFLTLIDSLSKTIEELENSPDIKNIKNEKKEKNTLPTELSDSNGKAINILINKDDIFSISILNETYEIVADFDGISVLSENIHISTPKNNFFVKIGNKYIEIHNKKDHFLVNTNFEDVEFANAINNVAFAKKNNKIELNIKEAFKLASINNKIELSMLNTSIANITNSTSLESIDENSICDNRTLLISEETQKVYLPYTIEEIMKKLASSDEYQTPKEVIENEYTLPLSTFKMPIISRFKEAYRFMRVKEKSSIYAAVDLGLELMFNSNLNPAVIRAAKDLKELNIYLDCLYENEVDKFDCFKIVYKVLPKIQ